VDQDKQGLPAILDAIKDPYEAGYSFRVVKKMGAAANDIVPELLRLIDDRYGPSCCWASNALRVIDPEAAKKAGVR
jgi:hypothetical protein